MAKHCHQAFVPALLAKVPDRDKAGSKAMASSSGKDHDQLDRKFHTLLYVT